MRKFHVFSAVAILSAAYAVAQQMPRGTATMDIRDSRVTVNYGRPSLKGAKVQEKMSQLPNDRMWRAGANQVTTLKTDTDIMVGDKKVAAGEYSVYVHCPEDGKYELALNSVLGQPLGKIWSGAPDNMKNEPWPHFKYAEEIGDKEVARVAMKSHTSEEKVDMFTIQFADDMMIMSWGDQKWSVEVKAAD